MGFSRISKLPRILQPNTVGAGTWGTNLSKSYQSTHDSSRSKFRIDRKHTYY
jgi:hypothetical protein